MTAFAATAARPDHPLERTTAALETEPSRQRRAADVHDLPEWHAHDVTGPVEFTEVRSRTWYADRATVESRRPFHRTTTVTRTGHPPMELA